MSPSEYLIGVALISIVVGGFCISARSLRRALVGGWDGAPAVLAQIVLTISVAIVTCELLGLAGLLTAPALAIAAICPAAALLWRGGTAGAPTLPAPPIGRAAFAIAIAASLLTAVHWAGPVLRSLDVGIYRQDSLWYHLPTAAWFAQTGSIGGLLFTDPLKLTVWYYPANSELLHSIGMVVLDNDLLSPLLNFGWLSVALLSAWCIGRPLGLAAATLLGAVLVVNSDMMLVQAGNAPSDIAALACLLASIAIFANGWGAQPAVTRRGGIGTVAIEPGVLAVAALAAGLAIGTKVTMLVPIGVITIAVLAAGRRGLATRAAIWLGGLFATGGFWYLRNLIHAGNPLPWIGAGPLPTPEQLDLYPRPAHSVAEYLADRHAWTEFFLPGFGETLGPLWFLVVFGGVAGIVLGLRRRHPAPIRVLALVAGATLVAYVFIPISASGPNGAPSGFASNLRYAAPVFAIGLILLPIVETRAMARRMLVPAYAMLVLVGAIGSEEWVQPQLATAIAIGAAAVLLPAWLLTCNAPVSRRWAIVVTVLVAAFVGGYAQQRQYFEDRYAVALAPPLDNPGFRATDQWKTIQTWAGEQHGLRIGIVGTPAAYGQYIFYGDDFSNEVRYLGEPRPHGGLIPIGRCESWRARLLNGGFDAVVVTPEDPGEAQLPAQIEWTGLGGAAVPAIVALPAAAFLISGPQDPQDCAHTGRNGEQRFFPGRQGASRLPIIPRFGEELVP